MLLTKMVKPEKKETTAISISKTRNNLVIIPNNLLSDFDRGLFSDSIVPMIKIKKLATMEIIQICHNDMYSDNTILVAAYNITEDMIKHPNSLFR